MAAPSSAAFLPVPTATAVESLSSSNGNSATTHQPRLQRVVSNGWKVSYCDLFASPATSRASCCALLCCGTFLEDRTRYAYDPAYQPPWTMRLMLVGGLIVVGIVIFQGGFLLMVGLGVLIWSIFASIRRGQFRRKLKVDHVPNPTQADDFEPHCCTHACLTCMPHDVHYQLLANGQQEQGENKDADNKDSCTSLWQCIALTMGCGCCGCWWHCNGCCASYQEFRQLPAAPVDYITLQPWMDYRAGLERVRNQQSMLFAEHVGALSILSRRILRLFVGVVAVLFVVAGVFHFLKHFGFKDIVVLVATLGQAWGVLYVVYWRKHRHDVSLDAIIKLFASGFFLAISIALGIELIITFYDSLFFGIIMATEFLNDHPEWADESHSQQTPPPGYMAEDIREHHFLTDLALYFVTAFIVASLVEELAKFYCFWAVEHTDYLDTSGKTATSRANALTVGMVATAAGFACSENLMYCLKPSEDFNTEILTLLMRAMVPVHPVCAAIQSIGVVRRDVEKDETTDIGWAILPAFLLHGVFDFVVLIYALIVSPPLDARDADGNPPEPGLDIILTDFLFGFVILAFGYIYYYEQAKKQRVRIDAMGNSIALDETDSAAIMMQGGLPASASMELS